MPSVVLLTTDNKSANMSIRLNNFAILVTVLLLGSAVFGDDDSITIYEVEIGSSVTFPNSVGVMQSCAIETNTGHVYSLVPVADEGIPDDISLPAPVTCAPVISPVNENHAGIWTVTVVSSGVTTVSRFQLHVYDNATIRPTALLEPYLGTTIAVHLPEYFENLIDCIVESPTGEIFSTFDNHSPDSEDIRASMYQCGVVIRVREIHEGDWRLIAVVEAGVNYTATFTVNIRNATDTSDQYKILSLEHGTSATVELGPSDATFCEIKRPSGTMVPLHTGKCRDTIDSVNQAHAGTWIARYALPGQTDIVEKLLEVVTFDSQVVVATVDRRKNSNQINLLCRARADVVSFCKFVRPDGKTLHFPTGLGNDDYVYYGNGTIDTSHDCGVTILKPSAVDYGAWKCIVGINSNELTGSIIRVAKLESDRNSDDIKLTDVEPVYVRKGDSFTIRCGANAALSYCWVRSPNGTAYTSAISSGYLTSDLVYTGAGLLLGECGVVVRNSVDSDHGVWKCNMGISKGPEMSSIVPVHVAESALMPVTSEILVRRSHTNTVLSCQVLPGYDQSIDYCRWVRPDGSGIHYSQDSRIVTAQASRSCHITIRAHEESDLGNWNCIAGFVGATETGFATIQLRLAENSSSTTRGQSGVWALCICLLLGIVTVTFGCIAIHLARSTIRTRRDKSDAPPAYESTVGSNNRPIPASTNP